MHVISRKALREAAETHADAAGPLDAWFKVASKAEWHGIEDVRKTYASADAVDGYTVFNIKGKKYRLIVKIAYRWQRVFVKHFLTHAEYNKNEWKK